MLGYFHLLVLLCVLGAQGYQNRFLKSRYSTGIRNDANYNKLDLKAPREVLFSPLLCSLADETSRFSSDPIYDSLRETLKGTCIYLVGMMGTGKSSVGDAIAKEIGYRFIDSDEVAEYMIEMPITDFFAAGREEEFRTLEYQILMEMAQYTRVVIATGGGVVTKNENWGLLRHGIVVFLDMQASDIYTRLTTGPDASAQMAKRPLLSGDDPKAALEKLSSERDDKYRQADVVVSVQLNDDTKTVAYNVVQGIINFIASNPPLWQEWSKKREMQGLDQAMKTNPDASTELFKEKLIPTGISKATE